jgi:hypothetical protein
LPQFDQLIKIFLQLFPAFLSKPLLKNGFLLGKKGAFFSRSFSLAKLSFFFFGAFVALRARGFFVLKAIFFLPESKKFLSLPTLLGTTVSLSRI